MSKFDETIVSNLTQKLGRLDAERREVLKQLRKSPEYTLQYLKQCLNSIISENANRWYNRTNAKNEKAYFKLISYEIISKKNDLDFFHKPTTPRYSALKRARVTTVKNVDVVTKGNVSLAEIKLTWKVWGYNALELRDEIETITLSVFKDIVPQILNGRLLATDFDESKILKATLAVKKKELEEQLKKIKDEINAIK